MLILLSRESDQCAVRARLGVASHLFSHLIDQHASHCMGKMSESDFGFENSNSKIRNLSPWRGTAGSTICQLNTLGSKIPHLSPYKGAFLLRYFAHTKGKNLINRVVYHTNMGESRLVPFPTAQQVHLLACSPHCLFNAERQVGKL